MATRQEVFAAVFPSGSGNVQLVCKAPGTPADDVRMVAATQYNLDAGAVANVATTAAIDTATRHIDRSIIWLTGMSGVTVPVEGGRDLYVSVTNGCIVQLSFEITSAD